MSDLLRQEFINKLSNQSQDRREKEIVRQDRILFNDNLRALIAELSLNSDE